MHDIDLLTWLNQHLIPYSLPVLQFVSDTTTPSSLIVTLIILAASFVKRSLSMRNTFYILCVVLILVFIASQGLKMLIDRDRPFDSFPFIQKLSDGGGSSFPSGHTMEAFAMATALSLLFSKWKIVVPVFFWALIVAYSRMALGVHYPSDVAAGIVIGAFIGWIVPWSFRRIWPGAQFRNATPRTDP